MFGLRRKSMARRMRTSKFKWVTGVVKKNVFLALKLNDIFQDA